ncbi:MAG: protease inhibitor I42 family protein [Patescibacteria group bacterium]
MKRLLTFFALAVFIAAPLTGVRAATLTAGTLIKASGQAVYYYTSDGKRLVFPNEKTYFTWFSNFSNIMTITDAELAAIPIGGNVTYRPGVKMIKITTDPKVYAVDDGGKLRWVSTEAIASTLYGSDWARKVDDVPDAFFTDYADGTTITDASSFVPSTVTARNTAPGTTTPSTPDQTVVTEETSETVTAEVGNQLSITMDANPSTGYTWQKTFPSSFLSLISDTNASTSTLIGAGGTETFLFQATATGTGDIVLTYKRAWDTTTPPAKRHTIHVTITAASSAASNISLAVQSQVQTNEKVPITANILNVKAGDSTKISVDGIDVTTCGAISTCSGNYTIPSAGALATSTVTAVLTHANGTTETAHATLLLVGEVQRDSIYLDIPRTTINITTTFIATAYPGPNLTAQDIYFVLDGSTVKDCGPQPTSCKYQNTLSGGIGSTHTLYARVKSTTGQFYRSKTYTITVSNNDAPMISVLAGKTNMYSTETVDVTGTASDDDGISTMSIYQNGTVIKTCTGVSSCTAIAGPFTLPVGTVLNFAASATDMKGLVSSSTQDALVTITK